jgi:DNA mismatch endonuclease (patch repair protein)
METDVNTSARLARIRQHGTDAELQVRKLIAELGLRYRTKNRDLPGSPDLANRTGRWAVFVHGCFWHAHRGCRRATTPKRNREFWTEKFETNKKRDARAVMKLHQMGYCTVVIWECELVTPEKVRSRLRRFGSQISAKRLS